MNNRINQKVVNDFGDEWERYDQINLNSNELKVYFDKYFSIFPWHLVNDSSVGFDLGCGSGRWAAFVAPRVGYLNCMDPSSKAINVAKKRLNDFTNVRFFQNFASDIPLEDSSQDFGYSLGVLHHIQDTQGALNNCVNKLKKGAPFLIYLYYKLDDRPRWFRYLWFMSDKFRRIICILPFKLKVFVTSLIAALIYYPVSIACKILSSMGINTNPIPLSQYRNSSFYTMRTDALDRFGTALEKRFTKIEIHELMTRAGLGKITFSNNDPYWVAVGYKLE